MKILFITTISNTVNAFLIPHIKMLIAQGHQVDVAYNIVQEVDPRLIEYGCRVFPVEFQRSPIEKDNYKAYKKIKKILHEEKYDLVHTHTPVASILSRFAGRSLPNTKFLYTAHGFHFFKGAPLINWLVYYNMEKIFARWTDGIITMNDEDYINALNLNKKKNLVFKTHGVGIDLRKFKQQSRETKYEIRQSYGYKEEAFILIYVAEMSDRKNQSLLIETMKILENKIPNLKLLLVGEGDLLPLYKNRVKELNLEGNIEFLGYRKDIDKLMTLSDLAVSSSKQEGLPVNVMEAMATGLPLVVTGCRGNRDLVSNGDNGYVIKKNSPSDFSKAIENLYISEERRTSFGLQSRILIKNYSIEAVSTELESIYKIFLQEY